MKFRVETPAPKELHTWPVQSQQHEHEHEHGSRAGRVIVAAVGRILAGPRLATVSRRRRNAPHRLGTIGLLEERLEQRQLLTDTVSIIALDQNASEPGDTNTGMFRISRTGGDNSAGLTVRYQVLLGSNAATPGGDYQALIDQFLMGSTRIPASANFVDVLVQPTVDVFPESTEEVTLQIVPHVPQYAIGSPETATV